MPLKRVFEYFLSKTHMKYEWNIHRNLVSKSFVAFILNNFWLLDFFDGNQITQFQFSLNFESILSDFLLLV